MSDEIDKVGITDAEIEQIVETANEQLLAIPLDMPITRDLMVLLDSYREENGNFNPPPNQINFNVFKAIIKLEKRVAALERATKAN